jgi:hypothetical protein
MTRFEGYLEAGLFLSVPRQQQAESRTSRLTNADRGKTDPRISIDKVCSRGDAFDDPHPTVLDEMVSWGTSYATFTFSAAADSDSTLGCLDHL